jgi:hypothetical protein
MRVPGGGLDADGLPDKVWRLRRGLGFRDLGLKVPMAVPQPMALPPTEDEQMMLGGTTGPVLGPLSRPDLVSATAEERRRPKHGKSKLLQIRWATATPSLW